MEARMKISFAQLLEKGMTFTSVSDLLAGNRSLSTKVDKWSEGLVSLSSEGPTELLKNNNESVPRHYLEGTIRYSAITKSLHFEDATGTLPCTVASLKFTCYWSRRRYPYWIFIPPKPGWCFVIKNNTLIVSVYVACVSLDSLLSSIIVCILQGARRY